MITRRVPLHALYREIEALGGADDTAEAKIYNRAIDAALAVLRASGFSDGSYVDQREYDNRERARKAIETRHPWPAAAE